MIRTLLIQAVFSWYCYHDSSVTATSSFFLIAVKLTFHKQKYLTWRHFGDTCLIIRSSMMVELSLEASSYSTLSFMTWQTYEQWINKQKYFNAYLLLIRNNVRMCNHHPVDTRRKLNVHKAFRRRPGRLLNVLYAFNLRPVSIRQSVCKATL